MSDKTHDEMWDTLVAENVKLQAQVKRYEQMLKPYFETLKITAEYNAGYEDILRENEALQENE